MSDRHVLERRLEPDDWEGAIADFAGPQLVVGGPGTGKTEFLVRRAVHLIVEEHASPGELLILAFSRRAAHHLRKRIEHRLARSSTGIPASTFHSFAHRVLEAHGPSHFDWDHVPNLLTGPEQVALVSELLAVEEPTAWPAAFGGLLDSRTFAEEVADFLMRAAERLIDPPGLAEAARGRGDWRALPGFYARYLAELERRDRIDYGTLQARAVRLLEDPEVGAAVGAQYRFVLVDDYEDTTAAQARLLELVTARHGNLTVGADPYESIYSFRGAELRNVADFPERFRDGGGDAARRLVLAHSFRVPAEVLRAAERVTAGGDLPGAAGPVEPATHPGRVEARLFHQESGEAEWIAREIQRIHVEEGLPFRSMAVLVRSKRRFLPELSRALGRRGISHDPPSARLVDHPAVRILFDCATAAIDGAREDVGGVVAADLAVRRLLLGPLIGLSLGEERRLLRLRRRSGRRWSDLLAAELDGGGELAALLADPAWVTRGSAAEGFWRWWSSLPQLIPLVADPNGAPFRAAWSSLAQALARQEERDPTVTLARYVALTREEDFEATPLLSYRGEEDRLTLTTLHQAKGLEFEVVFLADALETVFPDLRRPRSLLQPRLLSPSYSAADEARDRLREEMRLAYTAMTRARRRVVWTATQAGLDESERRPSRFLLAAAGVVDTAELPADPPDGSSPVTPAEAEAHLRRLLVDPAVAPARRLAAAQALSHHRHPGMRPAIRFAHVRAPGSDRGILPPRIHLSPSQAEAYEQCPRRYALERRLKVGDVPSPHARFGTLVHEVLARTEQDAARRGSDHGSLQDALSHLDEVWTGADFGGPVLDGAWRARAERLLANLYEDWIRPHCPPVRVEHPLRATLAGVPWVGRADRIERLDSDRLRVVDYKTTKSPPSAKEARTSLQLGFYLFAARSDPELVTEGLATEAELWFPLVERGARHRAFDPAGLSEVEGRMEAVAAGILAEEWAPRLGDGCKRCPVKTVCPMWPEGREAYGR